MVRHLYDLQAADAVRDVPFDGLSLPGADDRRPDRGEYGYLALSDVRLVRVDETVFLFFLRVQVHQTDLLGVPPTVKGSDGSLEAATLLTVKLPLVPGMAVRLVKWSFGGAGKEEKSMVLSGLAAQGSASRATW